MRKVREVLGVLEVFLGIFEKTNDLDGRNRAIQIENR